MIKLNNQKIKLSFSNNQISSHGGIFLYAEFLQNIGFKTLLTKFVNYSKHSWRSYSPEHLIEQKVLSLIAGYEDNIDAQIIKQDPVFNLSLKGKIASQSTLFRLENEANKDTVSGLYKANLELLHKSWQKEGRKEIILDLDSSESICYGKQSGSKYHGYHKTVMFNPLFLFCGQTGDLLKAMLRHGSCSDFHAVIRFLEPVVDFLQSKGYKIKLRADAGFNTPTLYHFLELKGIEYAIRLGKNNRLSKLATKLLPLKDNQSAQINFSLFNYQANSWEHSRRVYVKQVYHPSQLFPNYYFVLSNIEIKDDQEIKTIFDFYDTRGTAENYIKEGKLDLSFTRLPCQKFWSNAFRLQVATLAYNTNNLFRRFVLPDAMKGNMLSTLRWKLINLGCRIITHAREITCQFGANFRQDKLIQWIVEQLALFKFSWI